MKEAGAGIRRLGVHASVAGGLPLGLGRAHLLGCTTVQLFTHNPRGWLAREIPPGEIGEFRLYRKKLGISPVYVHASYLINMASTSEELREKSIALLSVEMERADALGADYVVLHPGSARDEGAMKRAVASLREVLEGKGHGAGLLVENTSGKAGDIASNVRDMARILEGAGGLAPGVCIDTCHAFAAGYDIAGAEGLDRLAREVEKYLGRDSVKLIHLNDSTREAGTGLDRHEHIGRGRIGDEGLGRFLNHPAFGTAPVILETPKKSEADDAMNLGRAKRLFQFCKRS
jgi:deoxyribonuclease-4